MNKSSLSISHKGEFSVYQGSKVLFQFGCRQTRDCRDGEKVECRGKTPRSARDGLARLRGETKKSVSSCATDK